LAVIGGATLDEDRDAVGVELRAAVLLSGVLGLFDELVDLLLVSSSPSSSWAEACGAKARSPTASRPLASIARVRNRTVGLLSPR
jgi:hypothetical protein